MTSTLCGKGGQDMSRRGIGTSALGLLLIALALAGCGGDGEAEPTAEAGVENRFATSEALIEEIRAALMAFPSDNVAFFDMCYGETEWQEQYIASQRLFYGQSQILEEAMVETFGERYSPVDDPFPPWPVDEMQILEDDGQRAVVLCSSRPRSESRRGATDARLHAVRIGDRWWVSGYTWEYIEELRSLSPDVLADLADGSRRLRDLHTAFAARIRAGEFATAEEAREARDEFVFGSFGGE
jgi:hypothetical protein